MGKLSSTKQAIDAAINALDMSRQARMQRAADQGHSTGIRDVNAAFDPDKKGSANLLASATGAAVGLGAMSQSGEAQAGWGGAAIRQTSNLMKLGFLSPEKAANPRAVKSAQTRYENAMRSSPAFRRREELRLGGEGKTIEDVIDLGEPRIIMPEELYGKTIVPVAGDRSRTGVAFEQVTGVPLGESVPVQGGPLFPLQYQDQGIGWASMSEAARKKQSNFDFAADKTGRDVVGVYSAMGPNSINFSTPIAEALLKKTKSYTIPKIEKQAFDKELRKRRPKWVGLDHPDAMDQLLGRGQYSNVGAGKLRSEFSQEMAKSRWRDKGFPVANDVIEAATEESLRDVPIGASGFSMFNARPGESVRSFDTHGSYDTAIPGDYAGGFGESVPASIMYPDVWDYLGTKTNKRGQPLSEQERLGSLVMNPTLYQRADQKWVDGVQRYLETGAAGERGNASPGTLATLAAPIAGAAALAGGSDEAEAGVITKGGKRLIEAWHGSPHKFDKFSMENIGTGEGAQAYGHGLYFADSEDVARGYRDQLTATKSFTKNVNAEPLDYSISQTNPTSVDDMRSLVKEWADESSVNLAEDLSEGWLDVVDGEDPLGDFDALSEAVLSDDGSLQRMLDGEPVRDVLNAKAAEIGTGKGGALYRAHLDVDPDTLLDWDKPLSEQSEVVQAVFRRGDTGEVDPKYAGMTGSELYSQGQSMFGGSREYSDFLRSQGVIGTRYADGMSRGKDGGTYNYVMFDDKPISIQERGNATPKMLATLAASAAAVGAYQQKRGERKQYWQDRRREIIEVMGEAADNALKALDKPLQGYLGLSGVAGALAAGDTWESAIERGARMATQPVEQTAYDLGGVVVDELSKTPLRPLAPAAGTIVQTGLQVASPL